MANRARRRSLGESVRKTSGWSVPNPNPVIPRTPKTLRVILVRDDGVGLRPGGARRPECCFRRPAGNIRCASHRRKHARSSCTSSLESSVFTVLSAGRRKAALGSSAPPGVAPPPRRSFDSAPFASRSGAALRMTGSFFRCGATRYSFEQHNDVRRPFRASNSADDAQTISHDFRAPKLSEPCAQD